MYKIVIVDDEDIVSRGLSEKVDWGKLNCTVCGTAANGLEGIEVIERFKPDIVITDIKMPGMNGLELAEHIKSHYPGIITILLSGYSEFDYARTAVRHQVFDYLLKPIKIPDLNACILKAVDRINSKKASLLQAASDSKRENAEIVETGILMNVIVNGNKDMAAMRTKLKDYGIQLGCGTVVVFEMYNPSDLSYEEYASLYQYAVNNIVNETYGRFQMATSIVDMEGKSVVVVKSDPGLQQVIIRKRVLEATTECLENIEMYLKKQISVGIGTSFQEISELYSSFQHALKLLETQVFWGSLMPKLQDALQISTGKPSLGRMDAEWFEAICDGDEPKAKRYLDEFTAGIRAGRNKSIALNSCLDFLLGLSKHVPEWKVKDQITEAIAGITGLRTFEEYTDLLSRITALACEEALWRKEEAMGRSLAERIARYVDDHYAEAELNLQLAADLFHVSASHLSRMFKKELGTNFNEYLSLKRVEKAKQLLTGSRRLTVLEVARRVGFADGKYFGQVYKKYYGMTPSEYKETLFGPRCNAL